MRSHASHSYLWLAPRRTHGSSLKQSAHYAHASVCKGPVNMLHSTELKPILTG